MEALLKVLESFKTDIEKKIDGVGERIDSLSEDLGGRMQEAEQRLGKHVSRGRAGWVCLGLGMTITITIVSSTIGPSPPPPPPSLNSVIQTNP
ncbi:hypothetical protein ACLB2K_012137 [Fragaria x ananassa]